MMFCFGTLISYPFNEQRFGLGHFRLGHLTLDNGGTFSPLSRVK